MQERIKAKKLQEEEDQEDQEEEDQEEVENEWGTSPVGNEIGNSHLVI